MSFFALSPAPRHRSSQSAACDYLFLGSDKLSKHVETVEQVSCHVKQWSQNKTDLLGCQIKEEKPYKPTILITKSTDPQLIALERNLQSRYHTHVLKEIDRTLNLKAIASIDPDLILVDLDISTSSGFKTLRSLRKDLELSSIPAIVFVSSNDSIFLRPGFDTGATDFIVKPIHIAEVKKRVKIHLDYKALNDRMFIQLGLANDMVSDQKRKLWQAQNEIVTRLGMAAEYRDEETGRHIKRMSKFCRLVGRAIGFSRTESDTLERAATMHDVGKIAISDSILFKRGRLTEDERTIMQQHTVIGAKLLSGSNCTMLQVAEQIALTHHEKWNGKGYPNGLSGENIPIAGRIACICDVFDALISCRPYKPAWPVDSALQELKNSSGTDFDPGLVKIMVKLENKINHVIAAYTNVNHDIGSGIDVAI